MLFQQNYLESNFIQKYGSESLKYECVDQLGDTSFKLNLHIISGVILFIVFTLCLGLSQPKKEKTTLKTKPRTNFGCLIAYASASVLPQEPPKIIHSLIFNSFLINSISLTRLSVVFFIVSPKGLLFPQPL